MAGFKSSDYGTVQYDFNPEVKIKGTIPDPSDEMLQQYFKEIREFFKRNNLDGLTPTEYELRTDPAKFKEMLDLIDSVDKIHANHELVDIVCRLCGNQPNTEEVLGLPYRKRIKFLQFAQRELANPE